MKSATLTRLLRPLLIVLCVAMAGWWGLALSQHQDRAKACCGCCRAKGATTTSSQRCGCAAGCDCPDGGEDDPCPCRQTARPCKSGCTCVIVAAAEEKP